MAHAGPSQEEVSRIAEAVQGTERTPELTNVGYKLEAHRQ